MTSSQAATFDLTVILLGFILAWNLVRTVPATETGA